MVKYNKFFTYIKIAIKQQLSQVGQLVGRALLYTVVVYLYYQVFQNVKENDIRVWYIAITECLVLAMPPIAYQIEEDIQSSRIVYSILRPINYLTIKFCDYIGVSLVRVILLGTVCIVLCYTLTSSIPGSPFTWIVGIVFLTLSILLNGLISMIVGVSSFWISNTRPIFLINYMATFCFGGLIIPLEFYPEVFRTISYVTPYPWVLWWSAKWITSGNIGILNSLIAWNIWFAIAIIMLIFLYNKGLKLYAKTG